MHRDIRIVNNHICISCKHVGPTMMRIGAFTMCSSCKDKHFPGTKYDPFSLTYKGWLKVYKNISEDWDRVCDEINSRG